ncbi:hypothetical protein FQN50_005230 [Emmonsiellopsis sp. PD_5]|nr:hypothetical protein FQN50_005230 [Emmonsiellopsis sp. PD_5]
MPASAAARSLSASSRAIVRHQHAAATVSLRTSVPASSRTYSCIRGGVGRQTTVPTQALRQRRSQLGGRDEVKRWFSVSGVRRDSGRQSEKEELKFERDEKGFKKYGFEEITATLPTTPTSSSTPSHPSRTPSHTPTLIDVRQPAELLSTGIIPTAHNIPTTQADAFFLSPDEFMTRFGFPKPPMTADSSSTGNDIVFYCKAGVRASAMAELAVQAGYERERIGVYKGSWLDWEKRGGQVEVWRGDE